MMKTCTKCNQELPATLEYFRSSRNKLKNYCRSCEYKNKLEYYKKRPGQQQSENKKYYIENKEHLNKKARGYNSKQRALLLGNEHSPYTETEMLERYGTVCYLCNEQIDFDAPKIGAGYEKSFWRDHVVALTNGGPDTLDNVKPSHAICNKLKGNKEIYEIKMA